FVLLSSPTPPRLHSFPTRRSSDLTPQLVHVGGAAGHARAEVASGGPQDHRGAAGHVLQRVVARSFDHGDRSGIAHEEAFADDAGDRKSTRLNSSHVKISYAVFCLK